MRITVTIDSDVQQLLRDAMQRSRRSFKETLNQALRRGLADMAPPVEEPPFRVEARRLGRRAGIDPTRLNQLNDELEVESFLALTDERQSDPANES